MTDINNKIREKQGNQMANARLNFEITWSENYKAIGWRKTWV